MCEMRRGPLLSISLLLTAFCGTALSQNGCSSQYVGYNVPQSDTHGIGGTSNSATTLNDCQLWCTNDVTCQSFDWDPNNNNGVGYLCWTLPLNAYVLPASGVTHYAKNTSCTPFTGSTIPTATFPTTPKLTTPPYIFSSSTTRSNSGVSVSISVPAGVSVPISVPATVSVSVSISVPAGVSVSVPGSGQNGSATPQFAAVSNNNPVNAFAIKPAYIVLAGLGGGCILLVIIAIIVICEYPLGGGGGRTKKVKHQKTARASIHTHQPVGTMSGHDTIPMHDVKDHSHANGTGVTYVSDNHIDDNHHNTHINDHHVTQVEEEEQHHVNHIEEAHHVDDHHQHHDQDNVNDHNTHTDSDNADLVDHNHHSEGIVEDNPYYQAEDVDAERPTEGYDY